MMKYRFYKLDGPKVEYLASDKISFTDRKHAGLFTRDDWNEWGNERQLHVEPLGEDEAMRQVGAPRLPGFEE